MKREPQIFFLLLLTTIGIWGCYKPHPNPISNNDFQKQLSSALHLKRLYSNPDYHSYFLRVFNDTIVGIVNKGNADSSYYFVQSIKNGNIQTFRLCKDQRNIYRLNSTQIEQLKNGCIYFPRFGQGTMLKIGANCTFKEYFKAYNDSILYAGRILFYKNRAIVYGLNGVYIFDITTEQLLWKFPFPPPQLDGLISTFKNDLVFAYKVSLGNGDANTYIICVNLNNFQIIWKKTLLVDQIHLEPVQINQISHTMNNDSSENLVIPTSKHFQIVSYRTGAITFNIDFGQRDTSFNPSSYVLNSDSLYVSFGNNTECIDIKSKKQVWCLSGFKILGDHDNLLIGLTSDEKQYLIVNKGNGVITKRILNPDLRHENIRFIGQYIVLNDESIYK